jgi:predicted hydrolase (HD superfamily)
MPQRLSRDDAWTLLTEWVESASLRRHCLAVEASMREAARRRDLTDDEIELWAVTGLLHDADYERHPDMDDEAAGHPRTIMAELERRDADPQIVEAIAGHAPYLGVPRETDLAKTLFAVDELSGFVLAVAYVRPQGIHGMTPKSVKKKLKTPAFAAAVSREDVAHGAAELGGEFDDLCRMVIDALEAEADALELHGSAAA